MQSLIEAPSKKRDPGLVRKELEQKITQSEDFDFLTTDILKEIVENDFRHADKARLVQMIATKTGVSSRFLEKDLKACAEKNTKDHLVIAYEIIANFGKENLICDEGGKIWKWHSSGVWKVIDEKEIKKVIHLIGTEVRLTKNMVDSILDLMKTEIFIPEHQFNANLNVINCLNGELEYLDGCWHLHKHQRENYLTVQIPITYDQLATAPRFEQFLDEIFFGDFDANEKKSLICELLGYSLLSSSEFEIFIILLGYGSNGKSVLLYVLEALLGKSNVCAVQPSQLDNRFQRAYLQGKLANIITEIAEGSTIPDAQLKGIVSGEKMTAEHKHTAPFDFNPFCTCWFGTNHMPYTRDFSDALFRRAIIILFNRKFENSERDIHLKKKLEEERQGILNLVLKGLASLMERGEFTNCVSGEEAKEKWRLECDHIALFIEECCELISDSKIASKRIYQRYTEWANEMGFERKMNRNTFTQRLQKLGIHREKGSKGARLLKGVELK